ncbi:MAG TPA: acetate kinase [Nakamurella sp.]|jgi:acetate kinase|nr:acetate kinase [Nakamurella sp.]
MIGDTLVLNAGSSSLKFQLLAPESGEVTAHGIVERIGQPEGSARLDRDGGSLDWSGRVPDHAGALAAVQDLFHRAGIPLDGGQLRVVGHRVVHGGARFRRPVRIDAAVLQAIRELSVLAPLHNPANAAVIEGALAAFGSVPQVAVFDTAFFATLPPAAATYAIDRTVAEANQVRRFGFHGISHEYVSRRAAAALGRDPAELDQIVLHLGNGASASAIRGGQAVDTSMGLTPMEGLVMGTRGGDLDPGVLLHLQRSARMGTDDVDRLLNRESGIKGMAGVVDFRDLHRLIEQGDPDAALALDVYCHRARKYIGAYLAVLGRADTVVFTAGVGENDAIVRARITDGLAGLGIAVDPARNAAAARGPRVISPDGSAVTVMVVPTNEELAIARQALALLG